jgi:lipid-A-disaccharide synthase-like uncharacterized protein
MLLLAGDALAAPAESAGAWRDEFWRNVLDPWFIFGMGAQGLFFLRFIIQWVVSERRKRSTIPVAFWYISLAGGLTTFVYAVHEAQPVFMLGQLLACVIYVRNLMLINNRRARLRRAGLPSGGVSSTVEGDEPAGERL